MTGACAKPARDYAPLILDTAEDILRKAYAAKQELPGNIEAIREAGLRLIVQFPADPRAILRSAERVLGIAKK